MATLRIRNQYVVFVALSVAAFLCTWVLLPGAAGDFRRFLGGVDPLLVSAGAGIVGGLCLAALRLLGGFEILCGRETLRGIGVAAVAATLLGGVIIGIDLILTYPAELNVPVPQALLFYPVIGLIAEVVFHLLPLALLLLAARPLRSRVTPEHLTTAALVIVAIAEPIFQITFAGEPLSWRSAVTFVHVFVIAALQLLVFRRYDFVSMYTFRLIYYAYWHIIWGTIRLRVLF